MEVHVDAARYQGHTICAMKAPDVFTLSDEDGHAVASSPRPTAEQEESVRDAAGSCPEQAVVISA
jgi:ferredoxin